MEESLLSQLDSLLLSLVLNVIPKLRSELVPGSATQNLATLLGRCVNLRVTENVVLLGLAYSFRRTPLKQRAIAKAVEVSKYLSLVLTSVAKRILDSTSTTSGMDRKTIQTKLKNYWKSIPMRFLFSALQYMRHLEKHVEPHPDRETLFSDLNPFPRALEVVVLEYTDLAISIEDTNADLERLGSLLRQVSYLYSPSEHDATLAYSMIKLLEVRVRERPLNTLECQMVARAVHRLECAETPYYEALLEIVAKTLAHLQQQRVPVSRSQGVLIRSVTKALKPSLWIHDTTIYVRMSIVRFGLIL